MCTKSKCGFCCSSLLLKSIILGIALCVFSSFFPWSVVSIYAVDSPLNKQELLFHITDYGMNQYWRKNEKIGDPFNSEQHSLFPELHDKFGAQILVPMPEDRVLDRLDENQWAQRIASILISKVHSARLQGTTEFEIQLVENMGLIAYEYPSQQNRVAKFAKSVYTAIGNLLEEEKSSAKKTVIDVTVGSNGTVAFTKSRSNWELYRGNIRGVSFVCGRATYELTDQTVKSLGVNKVFPIVSHGDIFATRSQIGNYDVVQQLVYNNPGLQAFILTPIDSKNHISHVLSMVELNEVFDIARVNGKGKPTRIGKFTSKDLRTPWQMTHNSFHQDHELLVKGVKMEMNIDSSSQYSDEKIEIIRDRILNKTK